MSSFVPVRANFTVYQGADWTQCILLTDPTSITDPPAPLDLPWTVARLTIRDDYDGTILLQLGTADGSIVFTAVDGQITLNIPGTVSELLKLNGDALYGVYDLVCSNPMIPVIDQVARGFFVFWPEASRAPLI